MHVPYLFKKTPLPQAIDSETKQILVQLQPITNKEQYLQAAYDIVSRKYESGRVKTFSRIWELSSHDIEELTSRSGFMHCTNQNYILANILVKSGLFIESDIQTQWTIQWLLSPHQYLRVRLGDGQYINVDCWGRHYGIQFGSYATGFNSTKRQSFAE